jgi:hypothetical protein
MNQSREKSFANDNGNSEAGVGNPRRGAQDWQTQLARESGQHWWHA